MNTDEQQSDEPRRFSAREIEDAFLDTHWDYGLRIHEQTADALYEALGDLSAPDTVHVVFARLYGEYAASLETFAALGSLYENGRHPGPSSGRTSPIRLGRWASSTGSWPTTTATSSTC